MATREDATLVVQILQWAALEGVGGALGSIFAKDFDSENATLEDPNVRKVLNFGETVGTFVKQGLLDRDLVYDLWAFNPSWKRLSKAALRVREETGEPRMYENFEALVQSAPEVAVNGRAGAVESRI